MLLELGLKNFVLVRDVSLTFSRDFTVFTGETGAGKSLLVQAVQVLLGARADSRQISTGTDQATVQAVFSMNERMRPLLDELGIIPEENLVVRRTISRSGRGRIYVNGALVTLQDLRRITAGLASLAAQHEYQGLLRSENHALWLDRFGSLEDRARELARRHQALRSLRTELARALQAEENASGQIKRLAREAEEIDAVSPKPDENEELERQRRILKASATLRSLGEACYGRLYMNKGAVQEQLSDCIDELKRMAEIDPGLGALLEELKAAFYQAGEVSRELRDYLQELPSDTDRLNRIEDRLHTLKELTRRFGPEISDVLEYRTGISARMENLAGGSHVTTRLKEDIKAQEETLLSLAVDLSEERRVTAAALTNAVRAELSELKLGRTSFSVEIRAPESPKVEDVGERGMDHVRFLFSPNIGEPARPLASIASGGELSRIMLALRTALAKRTEIETVIFDEIDAGIGGEVAERVGMKLRELSERGQVLAVTHFPQLAALAESHFLVDKQVHDGITHTEVRRVEGEERRDELARMLGGERKAARRYAGELLGRN